VCLCGGNSGDSVWLVCLCEWYHYNRIVCAKCGFGCVGIEGIENWDGGGVFVMIQ